MSTLHFRRIERRRTPRIAVFADLTVQGYTENNEKFKVQTRSLSVSGHGGMIMLDEVLTVGQMLLVTNENSGQKTECKVVSRRSGSDGKSIVAFEFLSRDTNFWKISFPAKGAKPLRRVMPATAAV
jgi:c-di-GMP-binding flagellar brake protein YcgR